jgi:hypothetical protein
LIDKFEKKETNDMSFLEQVHDLIAHEAGSMYNDLFCDTSLEIGKALSRNERERKQLTEEKSLIYGEVEFASFYRVLRKINAPPGLIFYDLGRMIVKKQFSLLFFLMLLFFCFSPFLQFSDLFRKRNGKSSFCGSSHSGFPEVYRSGDPSRSSHSLIVNR